MRGLPQHGARTPKLNAGLGISIFVVSAYMVDSIGVTGDNVQLLEPLMKWTGGLARPRAILADWNVEPDDLTSWAKQVSGVVVRPWQATCG